MKDERIVELFWERDENAIRETEKKYGDFCHYLAKNYLSSREDREECINDAMLALWNNIPPEKPKSFFAYLSGIIRKISQQRSRSNNAWKRGGQVQFVSDEILMMLDDGSDLAADYDPKRAGEVLNRLLDRSSEGDRTIFIMRFWFGESYASICARTGFTEGKVKVTVMRMRKKLKEMLSEEGIIV